MDFRHHIKFTVNIVLCVTVIGIIDQYLAVCRNTSEYDEVSAAGEKSCPLRGDDRTAFGECLKYRIGITINNSSSYFQVIADKDYDEALEASLQAIVDGSGRLQMRTWKNEYDTWENAIQMTRGACYAFIIILAAISIMNLINTMINSVHVRKKELGMMQAIGMSDRQLMKMLQLEGIFYTVGTLIISIGVGSLAGYPLFLYAKRTGMFDISTYHYPVTAAIIIILTLFVIQMLLAIFIAKSVRKDSLIERIRFSE